MNKRKLIPILVGFSLIIWITFSRFLSPSEIKELPKPFTPPSSKKEDVSIILKDINQTTVKGGIKQWNLKAISAVLSQDQNKMKLEKPKIQFYRTDGSMVYLTAHEGLLNKKSNDMEVSGDVQIIFGNYTLKTETLLYKHTKHMIVSNDQITIRGLSFEVIADTMSFDLKKQHTLFEGHVKGSFRDQMVP